MHEYPEKTLSKIALDAFTEAGSDFALASIFYYLKRTRCSLKNVILKFSALESIFNNYLTQMVPIDFTMKHDLLLKELAWLKQ